jgi:hypothetical protein
VKKEDTKKTAGKIDKSKERKRKREKEKEKERISFYASCECVCKRIKFSTENIFL